MMDRQAIQPSKLRKMITALFDEEELRSLCFDLTVDYDSLPAMGKAGKARELVAFCQRQHQLGYLLTVCQEQRPHIPWQDISLQEDFIQEEDTPTPGTSPYKGMAFFDVQDADLFFGRERLTADLITHLHRQPFLAVVGASGSGKSSIVRAGVIPTLQGNKHIDDVLLPDECMTWPMHLITPGNHPLQALAISLANSPQEAVALMNSFVDDVHSLHMAVRFKLRDSPTSRLLLFVDQFEELFTQCQVESERQAFIDNLMTAVHPETGRYLILIITLRADFYAACARYDALRLALAKQQIYIGAMNQIELRQAIEQPAYLNNWQFQPGLVDLMLRDVGHEPGRLPLLSHALLETWQRRRKRCLTFDGYIEAGGIQGAITETAERTYSQLTFDQQRIARHIFLRLTQLGDGTQPTRRRSKMSDLISSSEEETAVTQVLSHLVNARLIITDQERVEVAHEALIREWPTLIQWLETDRQGQKIRLNIIEAAAIWETNEQDNSYLYRGPQLEEANSWAKEHSHEMSVGELAFLRNSNHARQRNRLMAGGTLVVILLLIVSIPSLIALNQKTTLDLTTNLNATIAVEATQAIEARETANAHAAVAQAESTRANLETERAELAETLARAQTLLAQGQTAWEDQPLLGLRLMLEGLLLTPPEHPDTEALIKSALVDIADHGRLFSFGNDIEKIYKSPDDVWLIIDHQLASGEIWQVGQEITLFRQLSGKINQVTFSPTDGSIFVVGYEDQPAELHRLTDNTLVRLADAPNFVYFSWEGSFFLIDYDKQPDELRYVYKNITIKLGEELEWPIFSPKDTIVILRFEGKSDALFRLSDNTTHFLAGEVDQVRFSPNGEAFFIDYPPYGGAAWGKQGEIIEEIPSSSSISPFALFFNPNPEETNFFIAYDDRPGEIHYTDRADIQILDGILESVSFSANNIILDYNDFANFPDTLNDQIYDPQQNTTIDLDDEVQFIFSGHDGTVQVIKYPTKSEIRYFDGSQRVTTLNGDVEQVLFNQDSTAFIIDYDSTIADTPDELWLVDEGIVVQLPGEIPFVSGYKPPVVFNPDGGSVVIDYEDDEVPNEYRSLDNQLIQPLSGEISDIFFSPDGSTLIIGYYDKPAEIRSTDNGGLKATLTDNLLLPFVAQFNFSPDIHAFVVNNELWGTDSYTFITDLGINLDQFLFLPEHEWLVTRYVDGRAYWIDIPWLKTMTEASTSISIQKIENLLCDGPLSTSIARHLFNETYDLTSYLADREPQACK